MFEGKPNLSNFLLSVILMVLGAAISMGGWALLMSIDHESRISVIESNQFTDHEAADMKADIMEAIYDVKECVIKHQANQVCQ